MTLRKGDNVYIRSGNDKGKTGVILSVLPLDGRVIVEGINVRKKHVRPRKQGQKGEIVRIPASFSISRVMIFCANCKKGVRAGINLDGDKKSRVCKKCGSAV
jgi:large subunit ribosomal protein L24